MSIGAAPAPVLAHHPVEGGAEIVIDVRGRWDALALSEQLVPFHSFLVQHSIDRWVVHARVPGGRGESLEQAMQAIEEWRGERRLAAPAHVDVRRRGELR
jgi:hypothetical protein